MSKSSHDSAIYLSVNFNCNIFFSDLSNAFEYFVLLCNPIWDPTNVQHPTLLRITKNYAKRQKKFQKNSNWINPL